MTPQIETARFVLRPLRADDEALYVALHTDPDLMRHVGEPMTASTARDTFMRLLDMSQSGRFRHRAWVVVEEADAVSAVALVAAIAHADDIEIGIMVTPEWQSRRVAQEVISRLTSYSFEDCGIRRVFTRHVTSNMAGAGVMKRLRFDPMPDVPGGSGYVGWVMERARWPDGSVASI